MKCYYHEDKEAVGTCRKCGKSLCKSCIDKYESGLCQSCEEKRIKAEKQAAETKKANIKTQSEEQLRYNKNNLIKVSIISIIFGVIGLVLGQGGNALELIVTFYLFAAFPWGYKYIKDAIDLGEWAWFAYFTNGSIWTVLIGLIIKLGLSFLIGIIAMPVEIIKAIVYYHKAKQINEQAKKL